MIPIQITNHADQAVARLVQQYRGKPRIEGLVRALTSGMQDLETAFFQMIDDALDTATGAQLAQWGADVGQPRGGLSDPDYLAAIRVKIGKDISQGQPELLISLFKTFMGATIVHLQDRPGEICLSSDVVITRDQANAIFNYMQPAVVASVPIVEIGILNGPLGFKFAGLKPGKGFGDLNHPGAHGGPMASCLRRRRFFRLSGASDTFSDYGLGSAGDPLLGGGFASL